MNSQFQIGLCAVLVALFAGLRLPLLSTHFTHVDDVGVATTILKAKIQPPVYEGLKTRIYDRTHPDYLSNKYRAFRFVDKIGVLSKFEKAKTLFIVPLTWTYAPLQFVLTSFLIDPEASYENNLARGRLPSLLAFVAGCILWIRLGRKIYGNNWFLPTSFGLILLGFSWQNIIYSVHMASYAIGVPALIAALLIYLHIIQVPHSSWIKLARNGILLALTFAAQYQMLLFLPAIFAGIFLYRKTKILITGFSFTFVALPVYYFFFQDFSGRALNWNIGPNSEYLFNTSLHFSLMDKLAYFIRFFTSNTLEVFQSNISTVPEYSIFFAPINMSLLAFSVFGLVAFLRPDNDAKKHLRPILVLIFLTWLFLIFAGKVTLSPTRHTLILLPVIVLLTVEGLQLIGRYLGSKYLFGISLALAIICFLGFFNNYSSVVQSRSNKLNPGNIRDQMQRNEVSLLYAYDWIYDPLLMRKVLPHNMAIFVRELSSLSTPLPRTGAKGFTIAFLSHRRPLSKPVFEELMADLRKTSPSQIPKVDWEKSRSLFVENRPGTVEVDFLPRTSNGRNGLYLTILRFPAS